MWERERERECLDFFFSFLVSESPSRNYWGLKKFEQNLDYSLRQLYMLGARVHRDGILS